MCIHHLSTSLLKSAERQSWTFFPEGLVVYVHANQWGAVGFVFVLQSSSKFQQVQKVMFGFLGVWKFILHSFRIVENWLCCCYCCFQSDLKDGKEAVDLVGCSSSLLYVIAANDSSEILLFIVFKVSNCKICFLSMIITSVTEYPSHFVPALPHCCQFVQAQN
jgi:hypothetical protein